MKKKNLKKIIIDYMENHNTISLASLKGKIPHAATVFYVNIDCMLYFLSSPSSRHSQNFSDIPTVSATINDDYSDWLCIKGIQMEGLVEDVGGIKDNGRISCAYVKKFPSVADFLFSPQNLGQAIARKVAGVRFYKLEPTSIYFIDNEIGFGHREELILTK